MAVDVIMPKLGESITEGTIIEWKKNIGDNISQDETILEISTDKVDSEVPSPSEGVLLEVLFKENDVVPVGEVIARIGEKGESVSPDSNNKEIISNEGVIEDEAEGELSEVVELKSERLVSKTNNNLSCKNKRESTSIRFY